MHFHAHSLVWHSRNRKEGNFWLAQKGYLKWSKSPENKRKAFTVDVISLMQQNNTTNRPVNRAALNPLSKAGGLSRQQYHSSLVGGFFKRWSVLHKIASWMAAESVGYWRRSKRRSVKTSCRERCHRTLTEGDTQKVAEETASDKTQPKAALILSIFIDMSHWSLLSDKRGQHWRLTLIW